VLILLAARPTGAQWLCPSLYTISALAERVRDVLAQPPPDAA
jgi:hypothetical protein